MKISEVIRDCVLCVNIPSPANGVWPFGSTAATVLPWHFGPGLETEEATGSAFGLNPGFQAVPVSSCCVVCRVPVAAVCSSPCSPSTK
jgi:hypothetical protein